MKKYIILGGNGFIGRNLCTYLMERGCKVTSFDKSICNQPQAGIQYLAGDFFNDEDLKSAIMDKDVIIHAISTINPGNSNEVYMRGYSQDFIQTIKMCSWIKNMDKKVVFLSSGGTVYGRHEEERLTEEVLPKPINHYGNVKLSIENALRIFHIQEKLNISIARISNPYGPGQDYTKGVGFIDAILKRSMEGRTVEIWGDGTIVRDYIYIYDVCRMLYELMHYKGEDYLFNISSGRGVTQNEIVEIVRAMGITVDVCYKDVRSVDVPRIVLDNKKICKIHDFNLITLEEGLNRYYKYLCAM